MNKEIREGALEIIEACDAIGTEDEMAKNLTLLIFDAMLDVVEK